MAHKMGRNDVFDTNFYEEDSDFYDDDHDNGIEDLVAEFNLCLTPCFDASQHCEQICKIMQCESVALTHLQVLSW